MHRKMITAALLAGAALVTTSASAAELVANGGFSTGNFSGWTQFGNTNFTGVTNDSIPANPYASFGPTGNSGGIFQNLSTVAGQQYTIVYSLRAFGDNPSSFLAAFGNQTLASLTNPNTGGVFQTFTQVLTANSAQTQLRFTFLDNPAFIHLDSVSVNAVNAAVPEPATWAMMIVGFGLMAGAMRRKSQKPRVRFAF